MHVKLANVLQFPIGIWVSRTPGYGFWFFLFFFFFTCPSRLEHEPRTLTGMNMDEGNVMRAWTGYMDRQQFQIHSMGRELEAKTKGAPSPRL